MDVKNCRECGRLFNYITGPKLCPACRDNLESKFQEVKVYIEENPRAGISDIATEMDISVQQIQQWIREERLSFTADSVVTIECEGCGVGIRTGRYCDKCKAEMTKNFGNLYRRKEQAVKKDPREKARMRFLDQ